MRPIKFRAKNYTNDEWLYGDLIHNRGNVYIADDSIVDGNDIKGHTDFEVDPYTVGQITNLKDKDGTDIYEGDVLFIEGFCGDFFGYVTHYQGAYCILGIQPDEWEDDISIDDLLDMELVDLRPACTPIWTMEMRSMKMCPCHEHAEIIGNVHDTPRFRRLPSLWQELQSIADDMEQADMMIWNIENNKDKQE